MAKTPIQKKIQTVYVGSAEYIRDINAGEYIKVIEKGGIEELLKSRGDVFVKVMGHWGDDPIKAYKFLKDAPGVDIERLHEALGSYDGHDKINVAAKVFSNLKAKSIPVQDTLENLKELGIKGEEKIADFLYENRRQAKSGALQNMLESEGMKKVSDAFNTKQDQDAIKLFNKTFNKSGEDELKTIEDIVKYVHDTQGIDKEKLGEYLSDESCKRVLEQFTKKIDCSGKGFVDGMRAYLDTFKLPGEAQKVDRIMESFGKHYVETGQDKKQFANADAAYVLAFATIMLNTDLHNPSVKTKMALEKFSDQNKEVNNKKNFNPDFLAKIYNDIQQDQFKFPGAVEFSKPVKKERWPSKVVNIVTKITNPIKHLVVKHKGYAALSGNVAEGKGNDKGDRVR